jgi:hypothetical protein
MALGRMLRVGTANNSWQAQLQSAASARAARGVAVDAMATQRAAIASVVLRLAWPAHSHLACGVVRSRQASGTASAAVQAIM